MNTIWNRDRKLNNYKHKPVNAHSLWYRSNVKHVFYKHAFIKTDREHSQTVTSQ